MALDGITVHCIKDELSSRLTGGRIDKIYQPQKDEIILTVNFFDYSNEDEYYGYISIDDTGYNIDIKALLEIINY